MDPRGLEFADQAFQDLDKARPARQRGIVVKVQAIHYGPDEAVLDRLAQFGIGLAGGVEALGVQPVKGEHPHADGAAGLGQAATPGARLEVRGHDDAGCGLQALSRVADEVQDVGCFAGGGGGEEIVLSPGSCCSTSVPLTYRCIVV